MTDLRTAAQQALEAMRRAVPTGEITLADWMKANRDLEAALVEEALQKFTDVNQELEAALGCDHCNQPLYAAIKCRVCGRVTEAKPVQEPKPVAWMYEHDGMVHDADNPPFFMLNRWATPVNEPYTETPLYTAPPQRKPLTREEAIALWADKSDGPSNSEIVLYCRAIERAHGIGGDE